MSHTWSCTAVIECVTICFGSGLNLWHNYNSLSYFWSNPHVLYVGLVLGYLVFRTGMSWYRSGNTKYWFGNVIYISGTDYICQILWSILPVPAHISTTQVSNANNKTQPSPSQFARNITHCVHTHLVPRDVIRWLAKICSVFHSVTRVFLLQHWRLLSKEHKKQGG